MTITAVTFCVTSVSASGARLQEVMDADRAVRLVAERLAALPFCGSDADAGAASGSEVEDLLGAVFPHADAARNTPTARYVRSDGEEAPGRIVRDPVHRGRCGGAVRRALPRRPRMDRRWRRPPSRAGPSLTATSLRDAPCRCS